MSQNNAVALLNNSALFSFLPVCTTFAFMEGGKQMVVDPTDLEERTMDGKVVVGINVHQEICCLQMAGKLLLEKDQVRKGTFRLGWRLKVKEDEH